MPISVKIMLHMSVNPESVLLAVIRILLTMTCFQSVPYQSWTCIQHRPRQSIAVGLFNLKQLLKYD